jgi:mono/diheme cytochrome c family protein
MVRLGFAVFVAGVALASVSARADNSAIERGKYLVTLASCGDCHTPGYFLGKPDFAHELSGSDVGFAIPGVGAFVAPNLTPDKATGLGAWTDEQIIAAFTKGVRPDGRNLAPIMPWRALASLTPDDAKAIVAYLRSLPPVSHAVPGPFGPSETPTTLVMAVVPGEAFARMTNPK